MPLYEYECESCGQRIEKIQKFSDPPLDTCASCGGPLKKLPSSPAFQFKGSGWYITDYAKKPTEAAAARNATKETGDTKNSGGDAAPPPQAPPTTKPE